MGWRVEVVEPGEVGAVGHQEAGAAGGSGCGEVLGELGGLLSDRTDGDGSQQQGWQEQARDQDAAQGAGGEEEGQFPESAGVAHRSIASMRGPAVPDPELPSTTMVARATCWL